MITSYELLSNCTDQAWARAVRDTNHHIGVCSTTVMCHAARKEFEAAEKTLEELQNLVRQYAELVANAKADPERIKFQKPISKPSGPEPTKLLGRAFETGFFDSALPVAKYCAQSAIPDQLQHWIEMLSTERFPKGHAASAKECLKIFVTQLGPNGAEPEFWRTTIREALNFSGFFASTRINRPAAMILISSGCDVNEIEGYYLNEPDNVGDSLLHHFCGFGDKEIIKALVTAGHKLDVKNAAGKTPFEKLPKDCENWGHNLLRRLEIKHKV